MRSHDAADTYSGTPDASRSMARVASTFPGALVRASRAIGGLHCRARGGVPGHLRHCSAGSRVLDAASELNTPERARARDHERRARLSVGPGLTGDLIVAAPGDVPRLVAEVVAGALGSVDMPI